MRGASFLKLDIPWSIDAEQADIDEPSSTTQPVETIFEDIHRGALVGADHDCWAFEVEHTKFFGCGLIGIWCQLRLSNLIQFPTRYRRWTPSPSPMWWWMTTASR